MFKACILAFLLFIFYCLGSGVYYLVKRGSDPRKLATALTWRIGLSLAVFFLLLVGYFFGWITPHA